MLMGLEYSCFSNKYDVILYIYIYIYIDIFHKNNQMPYLKKVNSKTTFENKKIKTIFGQEKETNTRCLGRRMSKDVIVEIISSQQ